VPQSWKGSKGNLIEIDVDLLKFPYKPEGENVSISLPYFSFYGKGG